MRIGFQEFQLDTDSRRLTRSGDEVALEPRAFRLLVLLVEERDRVVPRSELIERLWPDETVTESSLNRCISVLRSALRPAEGGESCIQTVHRHGYRFVAPVRPSPAGLGHELDPAAFAARPAIAVLPFAALGPTEAPRHLSRGLVDDLVHRIAAWRAFPVIATDSAWRVDPGAASAKELGRRLRARHLVFGSVLREGSATRIQVRLVHAETGEVEWADRYECGQQRLLETLDEMAVEIAPSIMRRVQDVESERVRHRDPATLAAWEMNAAAQWQIAASSPEANRRANEYLTLALEQDADYAFARYNQAQTHYVDLLNQWCEDPVASRDALEASARRCIEQEPGFAGGHVAVAYSHLVAGERRLGIDALERAVRLNPSLPDARALLGQLRAMQGEIGPGRRQVSTALRLSPLDTRWRLYGAMFTVFYAAEEYDEARHWIRRAIDAQPTATFPYACLAVACELGGRHEEARGAVASLQRLQPGFRLADIHPVLASLQPESNERTVRALERAGLS